MSCKCSERKRPFHCDLAQGSNERPRQWFVTRRNKVQSAFNGYRAEWSPYSDVHCRVCGEYWRTKASFVANLQNCEYFPRTVPPTIEPI